MANLLYITHDSGDNFHKIIDEPSYYFDEKFWNSQDYLASGSRP